VHGTISAIDTKGSTVTITNAAGTAVKMTVNASTVIIVNDQRNKTIADLTVGLHAEARYQVTATGNVALRIEAESTRDRDDD
jgi:hypothetical protein